MVFGLQLGNRVLTEEQKDKRWEEDEVEREHKTTVYALLMYEVGLGVDMSGVLRVEFTYCVEFTLFCFLQESFICFNMRFCESYLF